LHNTSDTILKEIFTTQKSFVVIPGDGAHKTYLIAQWYKERQNSLVVILKNQEHALEIIEELKFFLNKDSGKTIFIPGYPTLPFKTGSHQREISIQRMAALYKCMNASDEPLIIVSTVDAIMQKVLPPDRLNAFSELIIANEEIDRESLIEKLNSGGYIRTSLVEEQGDYAVRGDILDIFVPGDSLPVRIEFFGDHVESIRYFSPYTQRGVKNIFETVIIPANEAIVTLDAIPFIIERLRQACINSGTENTKIVDYVNLIREKGRFPGIESMLSIVYENPDTLLTYFPQSSFFVLDNPDELEQYAKDFAEKTGFQDINLIFEEQDYIKSQTICFEWAEILRAINSKPNTSFVPYEVLQDSGKADPILLYYNYKDNSDLTSRLQAQRSQDNPLHPLVECLEIHAEEQFTVICVLTQNSQAGRLLSLLQPYGIEPKFLPSFEIARKNPAGVYYMIGTLSSGFILKEKKLAIVVESEIFGLKRIYRQKSRKNKSLTELFAPEELKNGDFIVHAEHGIGRYEGLCNLTIKNIAQDFILIVYKDEDKLYLPVDRMEMIGKYIGIEGYTPVLDKIGSKAWTKARSKAKEEVEKMAAELLNLYAHRKTNKGFAFSQPDRYYYDFEASFSYEETPDQLKAIEDVLNDMESGVSMDRLICGDVGYGKTEVAVRASFKAVNDGKQVAIVVPTTILAEQHLATFRERFSRYPVNIESLSRFRTRKEQAQIVQNISAGRTDIVIGTHRLLQKDIDFKSLGLLVIDEEQRFGVKHKEALKKKRSTVDVLALTATPIPRTLHLSLTGMRDISIINTPPADRQAIVTYITKYEDNIVKEAVKRELARKGQVFYVYNNVRTIAETAEKLSKIVPEARIGIAHGQLPESELEKIMLKFTNAEIDVLVCTTIIESGLDIPSANTMIIYKTENFGLSQIYQLRGRIGRGGHQAYAYLFISDETRLTKDAKKRLAALMEFRDLGSGFQIAMKDLQIRGAGTALGASQSGHIAAIGYDLFLKLLDQAVQDVKGEKSVEPLEPEINVPMSCGFPEDYIESVEQRLTIYRRLSRISQISDIKDMQRELTDRYGRLPQAAENMLLKIMLRVYCISAGVQRLDLTPDILILNFSSLHRKQPLTELPENIKKVYQFGFINKDTIRFTLGQKRSNIKQAILETKDILAKLING
jgi:transcription-repair coupling factor (superfamily II helicase)